MKYYNFRCGCSFPLRENGEDLIFDIKKINQDCPAVWNLLDKGLTTGVFQLETETGKNWVQKLKPRSIRDLAALGSILRPGCIGQNTRVSISFINHKKNRRYGCKKISIEELYKKFKFNHFSYKNSIISCNEESFELFGNKIIDVFYNGEKEVVKPLFKVRKRTDIIPEKFYDLQCTLDHKLLTLNRGWIQLKDLKIGERVAVIRNNKQTTKETKYYKNERNFRDVCFYNYEYNCIFCDWKEGSLDVNHIDGNRKTNNSIDNLCFMCPNHHRMYTEKLITKEKVLEARQKYKVNNTKNISWIEYIGYKNLGVQKVYDIEVEGPNHNFIAGNVVVHNCLNAKDNENISLTEHFCRRKNGKEEITYPHPELEDLLRETYGIMCYQEHSIEILKILGGFDLVQADLARRGIGKKKAEIIEEVRLLFLKKSQEVGKVSLEKAEEIFNLIKAGERYSFNKCISKDTVISRYNKGKHPLVLTVEQMYKIRNYIGYAKQTKHLSLYKKWKLLGHYGYGMSMGDDGRIRPNIIKDIYYSGRREIYRVKFKNGSFIDVTSNHKFPTNKGILTTEEISKNKDVKLYFKGDYEPTNKNYAFSDLKKEDIKKDNSKKVNHCFGSNNYFYTNGSYSSFSKFKNEKENICGLCHETDTRIEVHHKNGDRKDSSFENLQKLCSSCHKKEEYKLGRTKIGEKGYPSKEIEVESVILLGIDDVYDVEMEAPNHNFVANDGIVTCNSHAVSYAFITYWTAFQKVHFPTNFFVSKLRHAHYKQDSFEKISDLILDAKLFDVEVKLPDLRQMKPWFWTDKKVIYYGITDIKNIGESSFNSIKEYVNQGEQSLGKPLNDFSFLEFCLFCGWDISEKTIKLINSGALDFFKKTRTEMCYLFDTIKDLTKDVEYPNAKALYLEKRPRDFIDFFELAAKTIKEGGICHSEKRAGVLLNKLKTLKTPTMSLMDNADVIIAGEEDLLGISITYDINKFDSDTQCKDILNGKNTNSVLGVRIKSIYTNLIKTGNNKGREMAKMVIYDSTGTLTGLVFADTWEKMKPLVSEGQNILIKGQKQKENNNFIVRELCQVI